MASYSPNLPSPTHRRRPSIQLPGPSGSSPRVLASSPRAVPIPSPRAVPLPVPQRHGSIVGSYGSASDFASISPRNRTHRGSMSMSGSFAPGSLSNSFVLGPAVTDELDGWLDVTAQDVIDAAGIKDELVTGDMGLEKGTDVLMKSRGGCILVQTGGGYGLFDFADLNTVLLLVLVSSGQGAYEDLDERSREVVSYFKRGMRFGIDISQKNPCHCFAPTTPLRRLLPLFASGVHRIVVTSDPPAILTSSALLKHLARKPPPLFRQQLAEVNMPLHQFVSLPHTSSVLDAMQVMSFNGLGAVGVVGDNGDGDLNLVGVVTAADCCRLVVPSEGKRALGMGLGDMCKDVLEHEQSGDRGEERRPVHTITPSTTLIHAANLILATSSSRVFLRTLPAESPPLSPVSSFERFSRSPSPAPGSAPDTPSIGLPPPPPTLLSEQYVVSILDILSCLARSCPSKLDPVTPSSAESWDMLPDSVSRRRRRMSSSSAFNGFATWRWAEGGAE